MALLNFLTKAPGLLYIFIFIILYLNCPVTSQWLTNFYNTSRRHERGIKEGEIRLVGGSTPNQGNVEIYHMGKWGSICDDEWDQREGDIVCRSLGYLGAEKVTDNAMFGQGRSLIWIDNLYCSGNEERLQDCAFDGWGIHDCLEIEAAGVKCLENNTSPSTLQSQNDEPISIESLNVCIVPQITS
ncbi:galectin-3-binding protein A-like [Limulus polyphemus]|uniref:Galectin-3-binding protein A-like n=1 Tax=Limulus polyphemus TaxID=6850 RepID=A0ABM1SPB9_LIMPO|nr:galectin-3-binding protein A-like [Limulus polyphemus]